MNYICIALFITNMLSAQYLYQKDIGNFKSATSFALSNFNYFYVADKNTNEITKIDTIGKILKSIGGFGRDNYSFDTPADVFTSSLNIFVTDKNNHRISIFDRDLNYISEIDGKNNNSNIPVIFGYPLCSIVSSQGDIFVLDSENKRILKLNSSGDLLLSFGDYNSGEFSLSNPKGLAFLGNRIIVALDKSQLVFYDLFGNGLTKVELDKNITGIRSSGEFPLINTSDRVYEIEYENDKINLNEIIFEKTGLGDIVEALISKNDLYILTKTKISVFKNKKG